MKRFTFRAGSRLIGASVVVLAVSCVGTDDDGIENRSAALTAAQQDILGFESPGTWSSPAGPVNTLSDDHTQGLKSLQVSPKGYVPYRSNSLTSLGPIGSTASYDLKLPLAQGNRFWFGASQLFVSIPSRGVFNHFAGQVELTRLPLDTWTTLSFNLSAGITQIIGTTSYTDLVFTIVLNVPLNASGKYLLDNLRFSTPGGGGTGGVIGTGGRGTGGVVGTGGQGTGGQGTGGRGTGGVIGTGGQGTGGRGTGGVVGTGGQGTGGRGTGGVIGTGGQGTGGRGTGGVIGTGGQGTGGRGTGGVIGTGGQGTGGRGTGGVIGTGGEGTGGRGTGGVIGTGGQGTGGRGTGGVIGTGGQGTGGQGTGGRGTGGVIGTGGQGTGGQGTGGQGTGGQGGSCASSTHCDGPTCEQCTTDNCFPPTDGCDLITDPADKQLCETLYGCFVAPTHPGASIPGPCTNQGDPTRCWCGTNPTTCLTDPAAANGPCRDAVVAAAKTADPGTIKLRFVDPAFPLGRAVNLSSCRGSFCGPPPNGAGECRVP